jgi:hypothetical protein
LSDVFKDDFLSADDVFMANGGDSLSGEEYSQLKSGFVREWVQHETGYPLDLEQAAAVAATRGDVQVIARAGTGKNAHDCHAGGISTGALWGST